MNQLFGLGILLNAKDEASANILRVSLALTQLTDQMRQASTTSKTEAQAIKENLQNATSIINSGLGLTTLGSEISNFGVSMLSPIEQVGKEVISTSAQFEQWRMTLKALYKDSEVAKEKLAWGLDLASKTPFEVEDVTQALIGFKAVGAESDKMFTNANGQARSFLEYMGDLASLRPDVGLNGVLLGVRNLIGGDGGKSLRMRMDIDLEQILGREFGETTEEIMQDLVEVSDKLANGLMNELDGTWNQMTSNLQDQATKMFLSIGDGGAFDEMKESLSYVSKTIGGIDDEKLKRIGENIASAFSLILKPLNFLVVKITDLASAFINLMASSPLVSKLVVGFTSLVGVATVLFGVLVSLGGIFLIVKGGMMLVSPLLSTLKLKIISFGSSLSLLLPKLALMGVAFSLLSNIWKNDMGGIRSGITKFAQDIQSAFTNSSTYAKMGVTDMMNALKQLDRTTLGGWLTYRLTQLKVLWIGLVDAWSDYTLSDENFQKLNELGLLPLLGTILDIKMRAEQFFEGFKVGWDNVSNFVAEVVSTIVDTVGGIIEALLPVEESVTKVTEVSEGADFSAWKDFGETLAYIGSLLGGLWVVAKIVTIVTTVGKAISSVFSFIIGIPSAISTAWATITGAFTSITTFIGGILGAIGTVVTAILGAFGVVISAPAWVVGAITVAIATIIALIITHWDKVKEIISVAVQIIVATITSIVVAIIGIFISIITVVEFVVGMIITIIGTIVGVVTTIGAIVVALITSGLNVVWGVTLTIFTLIKNIISSIVAVVQTVVTLITGFFQVGFEFIKAIIQTFLAVVTALFTGDFSTLAETLKEIWGGFADKLREIWDSIMSRIQEIWSNFKETIVQSWNSLGESWSEIMDNVYSVASNTVDFIKDVWGGLGSFFSGIWSDIVESASGMFSWLGDKFSWVTSAINGVKNFFSGGSSSVEDGTARRFTGNMVGLATGGYVKTEGIAMLHPNEVVVNDVLTQRLRRFLDTQETMATENLPVVEPSQPKVVNNVILANNQPQDVAKDVPQRLLVTNVSNNTTTEKSSTSESVDNSIVFEEGAIQVTMTNGDREDVESLFREFTKRLKREQELRKTLNYA